MDYTDRTHTKPVRTMSLRQYGKYKLKILKRDFLVELTEEELARAKSLKTEAAIDQFCMGILNKRWG
jgi:hypothetical protein